MTYVDKDISRTPRFSYDFPCRRNVDKEMKGKLKDIFLVVSNVDKDFGLNVDTVPIYASLLLC